MQSYKIISIDKNYIAFTLAIFILLGNISVFAESSNNIENVNNVKSNEIIEEVNNEELKNSEEDIQSKDETTEEDVNFDLDEENEKSKDTDKAEVSVEKIWKDEDGNTINADNINKTITIRLFADGEEIDKIELNSKDGWSYVFKNLPKEDKNGNKIKYTIKEDKVSGYDSEIIHESGKLDFTVINKKDPTEPKIPNEPEEPTLPNEPKDSIEPNEPQKPSEPLKPSTKTKSTRSPQTYRGGIALVVTELVAGVGAFVFIRKRIKSIEK